MTENPREKRAAPECGKDPWEKLPSDFYLRDTVTVARDLLGRYLVRETGEGRLCCRVTETEAYCGPADPACHSRTSQKGGRTSVMYREGGLAYVYLIYGMYCCFNVVTRPAGEPEAVLIRSAQPILGLPRMMENRGMSPGKGRESAVLTGPEQPQKREQLNGLGNSREKALLNGPGKLCMGMGIDRELYGEPLWGDRLWLAWGEPVKPEEIASTPRINIDYAGEAARWPWRFVEKGSAFLSVKYREL